MQPSSRSICHWRGTTNSTAGTSSTSRLATTRKTTRIRCSTGPSRTESYGPLSAANRASAEAGRPSDFSEGSFGLGAVKRFFGILNRNESCLTFWVFDQPYVVLLDCLCSGFSPVCRAGPDLSHCRIRLLHLYLLCFHRLALGRAAAVCASAHGLQRGACRLGDQHSIHCDAAEPAVGGAYLGPHGSQSLGDVGHGGDHRERHLAGWCRGVARGSLAELYGVDSEPAGAGSWRKPRL